MKKRSLTLLFLTVLLLFGVLLRAGNKGKTVRLEKAKDEVTCVEVKKDMELVSSFFYDSNMHSDFLLPPFTVLLSTI